MKRPKDVRAWLRTNPSGDDLRAAFPAEWSVVKGELSNAIDRTGPEDLGRLVTSVSQASRSRATRHDAALSAEIRRQIAVRLLDRMNLSLATGRASGTVRFNRLNGWMVQRLFFANGLVRKPVSMFWYRLVWPRLPQRQFLMPLVGPKGIYCFYSRPLVKGIAALIGDRVALEIAAGDGTLSRFLDAEGVDIKATDDHSWSDRVEYDERVVRQDAVAAVRTRRPQVVVCSWPPAGNSFEREIFKTNSVEMYIVIGSRHESAAGNWSAYRRQRAFEIVEDEQLGGLVLPFELDSAVHVFRRRTSEDLVLDVTEQSVRVPSCSK